MYNGTGPHCIWAEPEGIVLLELGDHKRGTYTRRFDQSDITETGRKGLPRVRERELEVIVQWVEFWLYQIKRGMQKNAKDGSNG